MLISLEDKLMPKYVVLEKRVGQTPLNVIEEYKLAYPEYKDVPMAYAGRLDPMADGKLLVLLGEECKNQKNYHSLDKEYIFEVLLGSSSDTGDVLGLIEWREATSFEVARLRRATLPLIGKISLPYPKFSSRTVKGKPLHVWTLENRLSEIEIPSAETEVYKLDLINLRTERKTDVYKDAMDRISLIPKVTEESKALGRDFRRDDVRATWNSWLSQEKDGLVQIATFRCICSSGTYMRSLAEEIGKNLGTTGLAYGIHRSKIGLYKAITFGFSFWKKRFD